MESGEGVREEWEQERGMERERDGEWGGGGGGERERRESNNEENVVN